MNQISNNKYDLEIRTYNFSKNVILALTSINKNFANNRLIDQLIRSSTSIGANYLEANDSLGKKDFLLRMRIARKEAKETLYWLKLLNDFNIEHRQQLLILIDECYQIKNILSAIIMNSE